MIEHRGEIVLTISLKLTDKDRDIKDIANDVAAPLLKANGKKSPSGNGTITNVRVNSRSWMEAQ